MSEDYIERGPPPGQLCITQKHGLVRMYNDEIIPVPWKEAWEYLDKKEAVDELVKQAQDLKMGY